MHPRRVVWILMTSVALVIAACGASGGTPGPAATPAGAHSPGFQASPGGAVLTPGASASGEPISVEAQCRDRISRLAADSVGHPIVIDTAALAVTVESAYPSLIEGFNVDVLIFSDGKIDSACIHYPLTFAINDPYWTGDRYGMDVLPSDEHFPDRIVPGTPVAVVVSAGSTEWGNLIWGAVAPEVSAIDLTLLDGDSKAPPGVMTTTIANGYFVSFAAVDPWGLYGIVAYDAAGNVIVTR